MGISGELYRDMLAPHLGAVSSELDATKASIGAIRAALVGQYAVTQASPRPVEALDYALFGLRTAVRSAEGGCRRQGLAQRLV